MITRRFALFLLLAFSALRVDAQEPPSLGGTPDTLDVRRAAAAISPMTLRGAAKESPAASLTLRRSLPRRKGRAAWPVQLKTYIVEDNVTIRENLIGTLEELASVQSLGWAETESEARSWLERIKARTLISSWRSNSAASATVKSLSVAGRSAIASAVLAAEAVI